MAIRVSGKVRTVGGLSFLERGIREDKDSVFRCGLSRGNERVAGWRRGLMLTGVDIVKDMIA